MYCLSQRTNPHDKVKANINLRTDAMSMSFPHGSRITRLQSILIDLDCSARSNLGVGWYMYSVQHVTRVTVTRGDVYALVPISWRGSGAEIS